MLHYKRNYIVLWWNIFQVLQILDVYLIEDFNKFCILYIDITIDILICNV